MVSANKADSPEQPGEKTISQVLLFPRGSTSYVEPKIFIEPMVTPSCALTYMCSKEVHDRPQVRLDFTVWPLKVTTVSRPCITGPKRVPSARTTTVSSVHPTTGCCCTLTVYNATRRLSEKPFRRLSRRVDCVCGTCGMHTRYATAARTDAGEVRRRGSGRHVVKLRRTSESVWKTI